MILYLDSSALVKRYVAEPGSAEVGSALARADAAGTALISRAEVEAALGKGLRMDVLGREDALAALQMFRGEWRDMVRVQITEIVVARAGALAWEHGLRGYDAVHLAAATLWQDAMAERVTLATFDRRLWEAAGQVGLVPYPPGLATLLDDWKVGR